MNILHMKYAVEVAKSGSINKAAEVLYIAQPNLSRCIKELENDLGITIFNRASTGMTLTPDGEIFVQYATKVLNQIDAIEKLYKADAAKKQRFSISVPRASYIADAFAKFTRRMTDDPAEFYYMETNPLRAINNILNEDYKLGIIRYAADYDKYYKKMLDEKGLSYEVIAEFTYVLIMSRECAIASRPVIRSSDLSSLIELIHGDPYVPSMPLALVKKEEMHEESNRRLILFERGGQFDILTENPETFMWVSPLPTKLLERYNLAQRPCVDNTRIYKDVLIHRKEYHLSELDKQFITELCETRRKYLKT